MKRKLLSIITFSLSINLIIGQTFQDNLNQDNIGDSPSNWEVIQGKADISSINRHKAIKLINKTIIKPNSENTNYLDTKFVLEFDAYFDDTPGSDSGIHYDIRFWDGSASTVSLNDEGGEGSVKP